MIRASSPERDAWIEEARAVPVLRAAEQMGARLRKVSACEYAGPCPVCGGEDRFAVNTAKNVFVCRGSDGAGDAIALVGHVEGCDFLKAVEILTDRPAPEARPETPAEREARGRARAARAAEAEAEAAERARDQDRFRERERRRCWEFWDRARAIWGTAAEDYLVRRKLRPDLLPPSLPFRFSALHPLYDAPPKGERPRVVHEGPALLAAITRPGDGKFAGLQAIWIDLDDPDGKARVPDPETGEFLPARKTRGSQMGNRVVLSGPREPRELYLGEGSETVLSVRQSLLLADALPIEAGFWTGLSLGNLAGRALDRLAHPTERITRRDGKDGGPRKVPGREPDLASEAVVIPDSVLRLFLLGDGDSDPFATCLALDRSAARHARRSDGSLREVRLAMSDPGLDFNSLLRRAA